MLILFQTISGYFPGCIRHVPVIFRAASDFLVQQGVQGSGHTFPVSALGSVYSPRSFGFPFDFNEIKFMLSCGFPIISSLSSNTTLFPRLASLLPALHIHDTNFYHDFTLILLLLLPSEPQRSLRSGSFPFLFRKDAYEEELL